MGSIGWDIVRTAPGVLLLILLSLTALVWLRPALRRLDPIVRHGRTATAFMSGVALIGIASRVIAKCARVIAPIASVVAAAHVLNPLATDCAALTERLARRLAPT
jgi:hypothetical protein